MGALKSFDNVIRHASGQDLAYLPNFSYSSTLFVASDFMGDQKQSPHHTVSFVITTVDELRGWLDSVAHRREARAIHQRRISYAKLNDRRKASILDQFLHTANAITALSVTVLVDKRIDSLFRSEGRIVPAELAGIDFSKWRPVVFERMMRIVHLIAFFVAGVSSPGQNVIWITDEDEIAANVTRLTQLTHAFGVVISHLLQHGMGHLRVGTTGTTDAGDLQMEDFAALPDVIGGAVTEVMRAYAAAGIQLSPDIIAPAPAGLTPKAQHLLDLLFDNAARLRKVVFTVGPVEYSETVVVSEVKFHSDHRLMRP
jgi:hypothetical protein